MTGIIPRCPIAIVGGGPCGLIFARLLEQNNIGYVVFERDANSTPSPMYQGGTLDLHAPTGQQAIKDAGLFEEFSKLARWDATCMTIQNAAGTLRETFGQERDAPEIDRLQLRQLLLDSIPSHKVFWGRGVRGIEKGSSGWVIRFLNGTSASGFRLIIGADGAWSKVRPLLTSAKPVYSGKLFIEGRISHENPTYAAALEAAGPGSMMAMDHGRTISVHQVSNRSYRIYMGMLAPEDFIQKSLDIKDTESTRQKFVTSPEYYADFAPELRAFIIEAEGPFRPWPLYRMPVSSMNWARVPGVTLLGDAAHVSTPFVGEGVNMAMYDALMLINSIKKHCGGGVDGDLVDVTGLEKALADYEEDMFKRAQSFISRCIISEGIFFAEDSAKQFIDLIRNAEDDEQLLQDRI
ncbi:monooxygenase FAD-binding protein [Colletotrichum truncatum]|uniref:Monooxygenase FAD-binding protein n=1 Tax=Colletotrichum truncatum TaxID=5467 RepID=A0ACC3YKC1_COLTU|nr:monooxygenase FAD-binding protein [Colletotrichum truncatum]KAF6784380.1 monooxygenase FAD-binding protein [Colletotrichum truncatum]